MKRDSAHSGPEAAASLIDCVSHCGHFVLRCLHSVQCLLLRQNLYFSVTITFCFCHHEAPETRRTGGDADWQLTEIFIRSEPAELLRWTSCGKSVTLRLNAACFLRSGCRLHHYKLCKTETYGNALHYSSEGAEAKRALRFFSQPPHVLPHPSRDEVISESLLSSLDVRSHAAAQQAGRLECCCHPGSLKFKER